MRFCQTKGGIPTAPWNFLVKENGHTHVLFIDTVLLFYIKNKLLKGLILTDICYCIEKTTVQIIGLIAAGSKAPIWCNQRSVGFFMAFSILFIIIGLNYQEIKTIVLKLTSNLRFQFRGENVAKMKIKLKLMANTIKNLWQKICGIWE